MIISTPKYLRVFERQSGFTLPELMVTLLVLAVLAGIAAPGMQSLLGKQSMRSQVALLASSLAYARSEAVARVGTVAVCGTTNGTTCNGTSDLSRGWLIFWDSNEDGVLVTADGDELLKQGGEQVSQVSMTLASSATYISYTDQGESNQTRDIFMCGKGLSSNADDSRTLTVTLSGRTRLSAGATCP